MMKYKSFVMRMHTKATEAFEKNDPASWSVKLGSGQLEKSVIGDVSNPFPAPKTDTVDVLGANGVVDATEASGNVRYQNKTVTVTLQNAAYDDWFDDTISMLAGYDGRVVDFAFADYLDVEWYYTGRLHISEVNPFRNRCVLSFDTEPFMKSTIMRNYRIPVAVDLDRTENGWTVVNKPDTATVSLPAGGIVAWGDVGDQIFLQRFADDTNKRYTLGAFEQAGCDYQFNGGLKNLCVPGDSGSIMMVLTIDGSYYEWTTGDEVAYKPCARLRYAFLELLTSNGVVAGADGIDETNPRNAIILPSNSAIRPELVNFNEQDGHVILDGEHVTVPQYDVNNPKTVYPNIVLPGAKADKSGVEAVSIVAAYSLSRIGNNPNVSIQYREERLG